MIASVWESLVTTQPAKNGMGWDEMVEISVSGIKFVA